MVEIPSKRPAIEPTTEIKIPARLMENERIEVGYE